MGHSPLIDFQIIPISADGVAIPDFQTAKQLFWKNNRNFKILEKQKSVEQLGLTIAKEVFLPSVSGYYSYSKSDNFAEGAAYASNQIGIRAGVSLFEGFYRKQDFEKQKLNLESVNIDLREEELQLGQQLSNLYSSLDTYNKQVDINEKSVQAARRDLELVSERYVVGASTILDQMNAQASLLESQSNLVKLKYSRKMVEAQIKQLLALD